ncbi:MAG: hypothetical protein NTX85_03400 [Candidatus Nomurabacteria bacterium]|nr:hypothetical protein [Candidatus Nomurabacteria bacterium]
MRKLDTNLFTEIELLKDFDYLNNKLLNDIEATINSVVDKEKESGFKIKYDFKFNDSGDIDNITGLGSVSSYISKLIPNLYFYYNKIEINNKIKSGLLKFEEGFKEHSEFIKKFNQLDEKEIGNLIIKGRNNLDDFVLLHWTNEKIIKNFWKSGNSSGVYYEISEKFPLFKHYIDQNRTNIIASIKS